jgi:hypothetical protein
MPDTLSATDLRKWAADCAADAADIHGSGDQRARLMKMHDALLALADSADWLAGTKNSAGECRGAMRVRALDDSEHPIGRGE